MRRDDMIWVGAIQGGRYTDLIRYSATETSKLGYKMLALGSPTEVMENYRFDILVEMIASVKRVIPASTPLHLFGAGHPLALALAVALGCDTFDSASYILFARERRYMSRNLTLHLDDMEYLPCSCPVCMKHSVTDLRDMPQKDLEVQLAEHNLHVLHSEMMAIKEAIVEGRLWDHLSSLAQSHPRLRQGFRMLESRSDLTEEGTSVSKSHGLFVTSESDLNRPEVQRVTHHLSNMDAPRGTTLVLLPSDAKRVGVAKVNEFLKNFNADDVDIRYSSIFGLVPLELAQLYPFSQLESAIKVDPYSTSRQIVKLLKKHDYRKIVLLGWPAKSDFADELENRLRRRTMDLVRMEWG
jgi:7-cyano-7-deazaguanine tRNA-ribosyltransferase